MKNQTKKGLSWLGLSLLFTALLFPLVSGVKIASALTRVSDAPLEIPADAPMPVYDPATGYGPYGPPPEVVRGSEILVRPFELYDILISDISPVYSIGLTFIVISSIVYGIFSFFKLKEAYTKTRQRIFLKAISKRLFAYSIIFSLVFSFITLIIETLPMQPIFLEDYIYLIYPAALILIATFVFSYSFLAFVFGSLLIFSLGKGDSQMKKRGFYHILPLILVFIAVLVYFCYEYATYVPDFTRY